MPEIKELPQIRVIQFQMATCPETGGSFSITSDIPRSATAAEIAAELAVLREAGYHEMAATNKRKIERAKIVKDVLTERVTKMKQSGDPVKTGKIKEAIENANTTLLEAEAESEADQRMLVRQE